MDAAGLTLSSISLFLDILDTCDRLYQGCKLVGNFGDDFREIQFSLNLQWRRFYYIMRDKRVPPMRLVGDTLNRADREVIEQTLRRIARYFATCNQLVMRYTGQRGGAVVEPAPSLAAGEAGSTAVASSSQQRKDDDHEHAGPVEEPQKKHHNLFHSRLLFWNRNRSRPSGRSSSAGVPRLPETETAPQATPASETSPEVVDHGRLIPPPSTTAVSLAIVSPDHLPYIDEATGGVRSLWRVHWARHDFDTFKEQISKIREGNNDLDSFFGQIALPDPASMLSSYAVAHGIGPLADNLRMLLSNLHKDLIEINSGEFDLNVQLLQDQKIARLGLSKHRSLSKRLRDNSFVFMAQRHASSGECVPLLFECRRVPEGDDALRASDTLASLERPEHIEDLGAADLWGAVHAYHSMQEDHVIFNSKDVSWTKVATLRDFLVQSDYRERMLPTQMAQLGKLLVSAHLHFEDVRESCLCPRPEHFFFYQPAGRPLTWDETKPLALRPWLAFGFGKPQEPGIIGDESGTEDQDSDAVTELGLLLFQVASGEAIDYGSGSLGLIRAKRRAIQDLQKIRVRVGPAFSNIVHSLLDWNTVPSSLRTEEYDEKDRAFVRQVLSALHELERSLDNTIARPLSDLAVAIHAPEPASDRISVEGLRKDDPARQGQPVKVSEQSSATREAERSPYGVRQPEQASTQDGRKSSQEIHKVDSGVRPVTPVRVKG